MTQPDLVSKLIAEWHSEAEEYARLAEVAETRGDENLAFAYRNMMDVGNEHAKALESLLGREGQAAEPPTDPLFTELRIRRWLHYFKDDYAALASAINAVVKQAYKAAQPTPSTPIVPSTPDDPRFNGVVVEVAEEFAILEEDIPTLRRILARIRKSVLEEAAQLVEKAFEQSWVVQDTLDAIRALAERPAPAGEVKEKLECWCTSDTRNTCCPIHRVPQSTEEGKP